MRGTNSLQRPGLDRGRVHLAAASAAVLAVVALPVALLTSQSASAATAVDLGTASQFAVLAGAGVTNTGSTTIQTLDASLRGDVGTYPNDTVTGDASISWIPPAAGSLHKADAVAQNAQADNLIAYNAAAGAASTQSIGGQLDGAEYLTGVYTASSALNLASNGTVTFNAQGDPDAVFIVQVGSSLTMETGSTVDLTNGAQACHVFWQVSEDATIKTDSTFIGTVLAENAIVAQSGATFEGRLLAQNASVTLDHNTFTMPDCSPLVTTPTPTETSTTPTPTATATTPAPTDTSTTPGASVSTTDRSITPSSETDNGDSLPDSGGPWIGWFPIGLGVLLAGSGALFLGIHRPGGTHRKG